MNFPLILVCYLIYASQGQFIEITSVFPQAGPIEPLYSCSSATYPVNFKFGQNGNPYFKWQFVGLGKELWSNWTKSFVFVMDDPSALPIVGFIPLHWILLDIPQIPRQFGAWIVGNTTRTSKIVGKEIVNGLSGQVGYFGMCPPAGYHNLYRFTVFARTTTTFTQEFSNRESSDVLKKLTSDKDTIAVGQLTGIFPSLGLPYKFI